MTLHKTARTKLNRLRKKQKDKSKNEIYLLKVQDQADETAEEQLLAIKQVKDPEESQYVEIIFRRSIEVKVDSDAKQLVRNKDNKKLIKKMGCSDQDIDLKSNTVSTDSQQIKNSMVFDRVLLDPEQKKAPKFGVKGRKDVYLYLRKVEVEVI